MKHKKILLILLVILPIFLFGQSTDTNNITVKKHKFEIGGRIHYQMSVLNEGQKIQQKLGSSESGSEFRRLYAYFKGDLFQHIKYKFQFGFVNGKIGIRDTYIAFHDLGFIDEIKIGRFKEAIGFEAKTSSNHMTFIERSINSDFSLQRNNGIQLSKSFYENRATIEIGYFQNSNHIGKASFDNNNVTTKLTYLPIYKNGGKTFLLLGASYSYRDPKKTTMEVESKPENNLVKNYLYKTIYDVEKVHLYNFDLVYQVRSFSLQTEFLYFNYIQPNSTKNEFFKNFYIEMSYFLTKERRNFRKRIRNFGGVSPKHNFNTHRGQKGAFQIAFRFSQSDFRSSILNNYTIGLNWYANPNSRVSASFGIAHLNNVGYTTIAQMKFQVTFGS